MSTLVIPIIKLIQNKWSMSQTYIDIRNNYLQRHIRSWFFNARMVKRINRNIYNRKRYGCQVKTFIVEGSKYIIWVNPMWLNNGKTTLRINNKSYSYKIIVFTKISILTILTSTMTSTMTSTTTSISISISISTFFSYKQHTQANTWPDLQKDWRDSNKTRFCQHSDVFPDRCHTFRSRYSIQRIYTKSLSCSICFYIAYQMRRYQVFPTLDCCL